MRRRPRADEIARDLAAILELEDPPSRIEAFDVAHISATSFAAAASVWERGSGLPEEYAHWLSDESSELDTIRAFVARRTARGNSSPDLIVIDGGRPQLNAALDALTDLGERRPNVIAAVKPRGKHSSISRFLTADGKQIAFDPDREAFRLLHRLRDEAHDLANATHRLSRDMRHFYELASILPSLNERERQNILRDIGSIKKLSALGLADLEARFDKKKAASAFADLIRYREGKAVAVKPLIVPIRFVEAEGAAEDLRPIETR
jgi:excinuclease ABC subunit C